MSSSTNNSSNNGDAPSLIGGHAQFVKGAAEGAIGSLTGSQAWQSSAQTDKSSGIESMKAASANRDSATQGYGKAEEIAGKLSGCEGMEKEGRESERQS